MKPCTNIALIYLDAVWNVCKHIFELLHFVMNYRPHDLCPAAACFHIDFAYTAQLPCMLQGRPCALYQKTANTMHLADFRRSIYRLMLQLFLVTSTYCSPFHYAFSCVLHFRQHVNYTNLIIQWNNSFNNRILACFAPFFFLHNMHLR